MGPNGGGVLTMAELANHPAHCHHQMRVDRIPAQGDSPDNVEHQTVIQSGLNLVSLLVVQSLDLSNSSSVYVTGQEDDPELSLEGEVLKPDDEVVPLLLVGFSTPMVILRDETRRVSFS
jgi:hypothetical protein